MRQRCKVYFMRNITATIPKKQKENVCAGLTEIEGENGWDKKGAFQNCIRLERYRKISLSLVRNERCF